MRRLAATLAIDDELFQPGFQSMTHSAALEQAKTIATLLPSLMRQLMAGEDSPAVELPLAQLRVCSVLCGGPRSMSAISRELGVSLSAMTQSADRLERAQLVRRVAKGNDRRIRCLELTERGTEIMRLHEQARVDRVLAVLEHLTPDARKETLVTLQMLIRASLAARERDGQLRADGDCIPAERVLL